MVELEASVDRRAGVTFVAAVLANSRQTPQRVRLESRLDGPTWPPRRDGTATPGWSGNAWEATVRPGRRRGIGYASPAAPAEPPLAVVDVERAPRGPESASARETLAALDDWSPPGTIQRDR